MHTSSARLDRLWTFFAPLFLGALALDQWSKAWAAKQVTSGTGSSIGFSLSHNEGIVFGLNLPIWAIYLLTASVLAFAVFTVVQNRLWQNRSHLMALAFILAGAIGNLVDRIRFGYVVDFIQVYWWPTFNLADVFIVVGVAVLAWDAIFQGDAMEEL